MVFVDSHCHIEGAEFDHDRDEVIKRAEDVGVKYLLNIGTGEADSGCFERAVAFAEKYKNIFTAIGVHPHDAKTFNTKVEKRLITLIEESKKVIAWGEIGLDFYYDHSPREIQESVFRRQIQVAREMDLPIIIHSREADYKTAEILTAECKHKNFRGGIMHCFGGTTKMAEQLLEIGFLISFAGNVTFKKADNLRDTAQVVPLDKLLIETDCPYLAPEPVRGKRNEPSFVLHTAKFLADFYGLELEKLANQTTKNFLDFFKIDQVWLNEK